MIEEYKWNYYEELIPIIEDRLFYRMRSVKQTIFFFVLCKIF